MRVAIVGAGSLGSVFGGLLAESGVEVYLISRHQDYVERVNSSGLELIEDSGSRVTWPHASNDPSSLGAVDLVIVMVKSYDTLEAMKAAAVLVGPSTTVLSLQNGLGNEDVLVELFGAEKVLYGRTFVGGDAAEPGRVVAGILGKVTVIGEPNGEISSRTREISKLFISAGLQTEISTDITGVIWNKLLANAATGALAGVTRLSYGYLYELPALLATAVATVKEGVEVAKALGVRLPSEDAERIWLSAGTGQPASFRTSILQSLERRSKTEIDFINGAIVRLGLETGIATPVNSTLVSCVKGLEFWAEAQRPNSG